MDAEQKRGELGTGSRAIGLQVSGVGHLHERKALIDEGL